MASVPIICRGKRFIFNSQLELFITLGTGKVAHQTAGTSFRIFADLGPLCFVHFAKSQCKNGINNISSYCLHLF